MRIIRIATALACLTSAAIAQDYQRGIGAWTCAEFIGQVGSTSVQVAAYSFAMGYVSAMNTVSIVDRKTYLDVSKADDVTVLASMVVYCRSNLNQPVIAAADHLLPSLPILAWSAP